MGGWESMQPRPFDMQQARFLVLARGGAANLTLHVRFYDGRTLSVLNHWRDLVDLAPAVTGQGSSKIFPESSW